ncbi:ABC transporter permease [Desulfuromonas acetoxidans]|uniref:Binding-protein-dependent transport systems inner membrane component n=1 Tax=Desulfuromonas acetoxidans (strain DSM 684 / 11070) TaxID=281689 RepID=Q1JZL1_DESA6|nr:ABC transporter permease [Desulfuromonas acetoxidans]EAT15556.1 binding-protein-dependent transport systems inner membrane component [Desulfuromonas acetoxidans DSM 684]MBF0646071.1 ABC transporter permease [Desulfuromonas acetoxidans]NVD25147.1 ABC transporter permease [Desulfuromonas acetoxidans]NVE17231.1 ABC transporter permease [Desulfuromonas acetoxidans]
MSFIVESLRTAFALILSFDGEVFNTVNTSLTISSVAIVIATLISVPIGIVIALNQFTGKTICLTLLNTLMALPTVVVGLVVYGFLSRQGPLGQFGLLFTPGAMIIGQTILATPIVTNYTLAAVVGSDPRILPTAQTLGAGPLTSVLVLVKEIRFGIMAALIAGFGRIIAEVGVAMMLGGNIRGYTRTMTTAIALETSKGEFAFGLALGIILLSVALAINIFLNLLQQRSR